MQFDVITLFPTFFETALQVGLIGKAVEAGRLRFRVHDLRQFGIGPHRQVDDVAYGGGAGMVLRPEPLVAAIEQARTEARSRVVVLSPQGRLWTQALARQYAREWDQIVLVCGRYEGIDERVTAYWADDEVSIGDYVLMGGEVAAWVVIESVARLVPGVVGNPESLAVESFETGILDYPQYTRPAVFRGYAVPAVLRSGHHEAIERWRRLQALRKMLRNRPDLILAPRWTAPPVWWAWMAEWIEWVETILEKMYPSPRSEEAEDAPDHRPDGGEPTSDGPPRRPPR